MKFKRFLKATGQLLAESFRGFSRDKVTKLSGSLAYSTVFSMAPLMVIIIAICSLFFGQEAVQGRIFLQLESYMGHDTAIQLQDVIRKASLNGRSTIAVTIGSIILVAGATAIFAEIQDSINSIWGLKPKPKRGLVKMLMNRLLSFSLIVSMGFLLLVSLVITSIIDEFSHRLKLSFPDSLVDLTYIGGQLITFAVVTLIFCLVFKVLPDAKIRLRDVWAGAVATAVLFMIGKFGISLYLAKSSPGSIYGPAAALVILLVWTYYSSLILYFGAEFTKAYAIRYGHAIHPNDYAVTVKEVTIEKGSKTIQENERS